MEGKFITPIFTLLLCVAVTHAGVSYIRWGRTVCPAGQILLYKGFMVGNHIGSNGNGANYLCATQEPLFVRPVAGMQADGSGKLWGVELDPSAAYGSLFLTDNVSGGTVYNQDMVCARCYVSDASDVFMLPGRPDCQKSGYDLMYKGFVVGGGPWAGRMPNEYICLDEGPEARVGGGGNDDQSVIYPAQASCGSLPCAPYVEGYEVTCAVCAY